MYNQSSLKQLEPLFLNTTDAQSKNINNINIFEYSFF
jgi:hypothetical protein